MRADGRAARGLIKACGVSFAYAAGAAEVVRGVSLTVARGELAALIGANGSGKSTLVRVLGGLLAPTSGEVIFDGAPLSSLTPRQRARRIGYVPQGSASVFPFTALEVVLTGRSPHAGRFGFENARDIAIARDALRAVDALHLERRQITELSGGERQLVAIARAIAQEPECLILDEPSSALDLKHRAGLVRQLRRLQQERGLTALVVTHDLQLLDTGFDKVFALSCGALVASGTVREVLRESVLRAVFADEHIRAGEIAGRVVVWSDV